MKFQMVFIPRALALSWAGFWTFFFAAESWAWHAPARAAAFWVGVGVLFAILALMPWGWEAGGGVLLVAAGLLVAAIYARWAPPQLPFASRLLTTLVLSGPPFVAGVLFSIHHQAAAAHT